MIRIISSVLMVVAVGLAVPAHSAAFMKLGDVKGESTKGNQTAPDNRVKSNEAPKSTGLLVPAVQKAQDGTKKKGKVEHEWKVEAGEK